jgi:hypothetical protein
VEPVSLFIVPEAAQEESVALATGKGMRTVQMDLIDDPDVLEDPLKGVRQ